MATGQDWTTAALDIAPPPPAFSDEEMRQRHETVRSLAADAGCDRVIVYGANRSGPAVPWLTRWPVSREAVLFVEPDGQDTLFIQYHNHVPQATERARDCDVRWGGPDTIETVVEELRTRTGGAKGRVGLIGDVPYQVRDAIAEVAGETHDLNGPYEALRMIKSDQEIEHLRHGARLSDAAMAALVETLEPGVTDFDLQLAMQASYMRHGGSLHIHYLGITDMANPARCVPTQLATGVTVEHGSVVVAELSAAWRGYAGQVLRTMTVGTPPTDDYRRLHDVAEAVLDAVLGAIRPGVHATALRDAAAPLLADAGLELCDDLVHGYGGGYLPPVVGRPHDPVPDVVLEKGMTVVVQPNVITPDERSGVQTGELVVVTDDGAQSLHSIPRGLYVLD